MRIAIHGRTFRPEAASFIRALFDTLIQKKAHIQVSHTFFTFLHESNIGIADCHVYSTYQDLQEADFFFSIGGDGTLLESVTYIRHKKIPILGINTGRLGFLAIISPDHIQEAIHAIYNRFYELDERTLLHLDSDRPLFEGANFALNEFTIVKRDTSSMITVHAYINGEYLNSYWADGLIIATPTGSTGYSLSCGGPLVLPHSNNFIISPVSPHNLNVRPIVVPDTSVLSFEIEGRSKNFLISLDSRSQTVDHTVQLALRKEDFKVRLVKLNGYAFFDTLRHKLHWGLDNRN